MISFLKNLGIDKKFICSHLLNYNDIPTEIFSFGLFSLDLVLEKEKEKKLNITQFKREISSFIIYIFINHISEIFNDFITEGSTKHISLLDKSNSFSKFLVEKLSDSLNLLIDPKNKKGITFKNILIFYHLFNLLFFDENKQRILVSLSYYAYSLSKTKNILDDIDNDDEIFKLIEQNIRTIVKDNKLKINNSQQNIVIVKKLLDLYKLKCKNIDDISLLDFNTLIQNIIEKDYPVKLINKVLQLSKNESNKSLNIYLDYLLKITLLCLSNIIGGAYIYNSNFISKLLKLIQQLNFNDYANFILEMLIILKLSLNRKVLDISFLRMKNNEKNMSLKEYIIDILFRNEPLISNESFYYFNNFNKLLDRIKSTYSFLFETKKTNIIPNCFIDVDFEDSYLNIIKSICLDMIAENSLMGRKNEITITNDEDILIENEKNTMISDEDILIENEKKIEKKINEELSKDKSNISYFILLDLLRCLENLEQTNFYLKYEENSLLTDDKYDIRSIILNPKLPLAIKSLFLNFLLKFALCLKYDQKINKIYGPLLETTRFEKSPSENRVRGKYIITLASNESEKHVNETVKLMNIFELCVMLIKDKKEESFKKAYIEKNGLYDFCVSIIYSIHYFSNLIVNTNNIHELYLIGFTKLAYEFFEKEDLFKIIINKNIEHDKIDFNFKKNFVYVEEMKNIVKINEIIQEYIDKINSDSYNFTERKSTSIYQKFIDYHKGHLSSLSNNHYTFIFENKPNEEITANELKDFNGIDLSINKKILKRYNDWNEYTKKEVESLKIKYLFDNLFNIKNKTISKRELFYSTIFIHIVDYKNQGEYILNDILFLKCLIRLIRTDYQFLKVCNDEKMEIIIENNFRDKFKEIVDIEINEFKASIIGQIIKKIYFLTNYELLISKCFSNTEQENNLSEHLNCLILFLEVLGENFNTFFHDAMFKYKFDFSINTNNIPVAKYDDEKEEFILLKKDVDEDNIFSPYETLLKLHQRIFESLYINDDKKYRETKQNNLLIIFNSLTYCIIEYSNFENPIYSNIMENLYKTYFFWKKKDDSFNPMFKAINFEIGHDLLNKTNYIFTINNILSLFICYIKYCRPKENTEMDKDNYFYEIRNYAYYTPNLYVFHIYLYTKQIVEELDKNILNNKKDADYNVDQLIDLYKKGKFQNFPLMILAQRYYELIFILKKYYHYNELNNVIPDYVGKSIDSKVIIEQFADSSFYSILINLIIMNDDSIDHSKKVSKFREYSESMNIIFKFWRIIFNDIEVKLEDEKTEIIYFLQKPISLNLSNDEKMYYEDNIDRSSRDSKLISIYDNIDSFIFEMIYNYNKRTINLATTLYYEKLELINIIFFIIHNIILMVHYYKSWEEDYIIYNEINTYKKSNVLLILCGVHILFIIIVIVNWAVNRLNIEYFHALTQYKNNNLKQKYRFNIKDNAIKFRKLIKNFSSSFSTINNDFFPKVKTLSRIYVLIIDTIILNPKVLPFLFSLICLIFYYLFSQIFLIIPLILIANLVPTLSAIFKGLLNKFKYLLFLYSFTLIVLYIFSWIGFLFLPNLFRFEVVDKYNENIVDENDESIEEYVCSSSIQCILYFLNFGLSSGGALGINLISFKNNYGHYLRQFFFDIFLFLCINMIFSNVFLALITDSFQEMREKAWDNENDKNNVCFICDLNKSDCINQNIEFKSHIKEHSKWKYINFMFKVIMEEDVEFNKDEYYIWELIKKRNIDWFPSKQE